MNDMSTIKRPFLMEAYFLGRTRAEGLFEDRWGRVRSRFSVDIEGRWNGDMFLMEERLVYDDGRREQCTWRIARTSPGVYRGTREGIVGVASAKVDGDVLKWRYKMDLPVGGRTVRFSFDDRMYLCPGDVLISRAQVSKFGVAVGSVTLTGFKRT